MSRRRSRGRPDPVASRRDAAPPGEIPRPGSSTLRERLERATVPAAALLPLRLFFGVTFLYAGFDKLLDPAFLDASSPTSIQSQMTGFARRGSPIGGLVQLGEPLAVQIGLLIALVEIAIGLGALTGLAFRVAAVGGLVLSLLFWLTASWSTTPYYLGPDLPYAVGWLVLALAGHGGLLVPRSVAMLGSAEPSGSAEAPHGSDGERGRRRSGAGLTDGAPSSGRRALLQTGLLAVAAVAVASIAAPLRAVSLERAGQAGGSGTGGATAMPGTGEASASPGTGEPSTQPTVGRSGSPTGTSSSTADLMVATTSDVDRTGAAVFTVPFDAPAPLPAGDPAVIVRLADGTYVAYDTICTHAGCTVEWDRSERILVCPCHGAAFDPARSAAVLGGPTDQPLAALPIHVDPSSGNISLVT